MADLKITIIGAGSAVFASEVIRDICVTKGLSGSTVFLMDIDEKRLRAVQKVAEKYAAKLGANIHFERTTSRKTALPDSDYIINTALAGGHYEQETMRAVGEKFGYYRGLDAVEFNMVSDYYTIQAYNQFRLLLDIAADVKDLSPGSWFLDAANPVFELTTLLTRMSGLKKFAGFCHGHEGVYDIISTLELNREELEFEVAGFNHTIWLTKFLIDGNDGYPLIDEWLKKKAERFWKTYAPIFDVQMSRAAADMYDLYGLFPIGDTVRSGTLKYHYNLATKKKWYGKFGGFDSEIGWAHWLKRINSRTKTVLSLASKSGAEILREIPPEKSGEELIPFIEATLNGKSERLVLNVPNAGVIEGIPNDAAVEVPCLVDGRGIHPQKTAALPRELMNRVIVPRLLHMEWVMEAFAEGGRGKLLDLVVRDARTKSAEQAEKVLEKILSLPFNKEMKQHYR
jgi:alpha-galactosidase